MNNTSLHIINHSNVMRGNYKTPSTENPINFTPVQFHQTPSMKQSMNHHIFLHWERQKKEKKKRKSWDEISKKKKQKKKALQRGRQHESSFVVEGGKVWGEFSKSEWAPHTFRRIHLHPCVKRALVTRAGPH